jgi:hypothetical protein
LEENSPMNNLCWKETLKFSDKKEKFILPMWEAKYALAGDVLISKCLPSKNLPFWDVFFENNFILKYLSYAE